MILCKVVFVSVGFFSESRGIFGYCVVKVFFSGEDVDNMIVFEVLLWGVIEGCLKICLSV